MPKLTASHERWRRYSLIAMVNLGGVLAGVTAFVLWQQQKPSEGPATHREGTITQGFFEPADDVGYIPLANKRVTVRELAGSHVLFDVVYTTGADHFRVVPPDDSSNRAGR